MSVTQRIVRLLVFAVLLSAGVILFVRAFAPERWEGVGRLFSSGDPLEFWVAACLWMAAILQAVTSVQRRKREQFLTFSNEGGRVSISTGAIADYVSRLAAEFPSVVKMQTRVIPAKQSIDIVAELRVRAGAQVHEVCALLQQRIRESVTTGLGIAEVRNVEVSVREIVTEHKPA